jgi:hypothetical protein
VPPKKLRCLNMWYSVALYVFVWRNILWIET